MISVIADFLAFSGVSAATADIAKLLFAISIVVFPIFAAFEIFAVSTDF